MAAAIEAARDPVAGDTVHGVEIELVWVGKAMDEPAIIRRNGIGANGVDLNTVTRWLGNSPDVARKHYLQITPDDIAKATAMGTEEKSANSPQHKGERVSRNSNSPVSTSTETRGKAERHTREDSNLQPSVPKTDALSN